MSMTSETMTPLSKSLFSFAREADRLNTELRTHVMPEKLTDDDRALIAANSELRDYLSLIARRAEGVASRLNVAAEHKSVPKSNSKK
jgi:hypothetical protein